MPETTSRPAGAPPPPGTGRLEAGIAGAGSLRWVAVDITVLMEEVRRRRDLYPVPCAALGRALAGAAMLGRLSSKRPSRTIVDVVGDGPLGRIIAEADRDGRLRGTVGNVRADVPAYSNGKLAVGVAVGQGRLHVTREDDAGGRYQSQVRLVSGEIGDDLAHFLDQSEQTRSAVLVGVLTRPGGIAAAGGLVVEVLPAAAEEAISRLEANIARSAGVSRLVEHGGVEAVQGLLLDGLDPQLRDTQVLRYHCRCDRERLRSHLAAMTADDLDHLREEDRTLSAECAFCGETYRYAPAELDPDALVS